MPGLLNTCWIVLAFCAAVHYLKTPAHSLSANRLHRILALACVLVLLFPVISADDDQQQQMASETNAVSKIINASGNPKHCKPRLSLASAIAIALPLSMRAAEEDSFHFALPVYCNLVPHTTGDRSPPQP